MAAASSSSSNFTGADLNAASILAWGVGSTGQFELNTCLQPSARAGKAQASALEFSVIRNRGSRPDRISGRDRPSQIRSLGIAPGSNGRLTGDADRQTSGRRAAE